MERPSPVAWIVALLAVTAVALPSQARKWGSVDFALTAEGMAAAEKVRALCGQVHSYQRLRDGEPLEGLESFAVYEDSYEGADAFRVESTRHDDEGGGLVTFELVLDGLTLRPRATRKHVRGIVQEAVYGRDEVVVTAGKADPRRYDIHEDTLEFHTLQLLFLKFIDDTDRMRFSFLFGGVLYHFHANFKENETLIQGSRTYETMHIVCKMRGTWAHLAPALHFWIETAPPYRLVRYQARREVVELVE